MFFDEIFFTTRNNEIDYFTSGEHTTDMPLGYVCTRPFGVLTRMGIQKMSFGRVTLFCGESNSHMHYLLRLVAMILGSSDSLPGENERYKSAYKRFCFVKRRSDKPFECVFIGKDEIMREMGWLSTGFDFSRIKSMAELYDDRIGGAAVYVIELPECGMSTEECAQVAALIDDTARQTGAQFIITTNSPIFMGIKGALIYDFDRNPIVPQPYNRSTARKRFSRIYEEICAAHTRQKTDEE